MGQDWKKKTEEFIAKVENTRFNREDIAGLKPFFEGKVAEQFSRLYSPEELTTLKALQDTDQAIENRMKVKTSSWYAKLAERSVPLANLIKANPEETTDLSGQADPSSQNSYTPVEGMIHKYPEIVLLYVAKTCSAHCRYCYRLDLFSGKTGKGLAKIEDVVEYITANNKTAMFPITEALLSGGDPMVMLNSKLAGYMVGLAEAGVTTIRIGTKELAFFPHRFDNNLFAMLDAFHEAYPHVRLNYMVHFTHPDEFLAKDENGNYIPQGTRFQWMPEVETPVAELARRRHFIRMENQTPIIRNVNDNASALRLLQAEMYHHGIGNHYFFQCREIEGHKAFGLPVEKTLRIFKESQRGLSGAETHAKLAMSTGWGKMEIIGLTKLQDKKENAIIFRLSRSPGNAEELGDLIVAKSNPEALWFSGYLDRIIHDGTGKLQEMREEAITSKTVELPRFQEKLDPQQRVKALA